MWLAGSAQTHCWEGLAAAAAVAAAWAELYLRVIQKVPVGTGSVPPRMRCSNPAGLSHLEGIPPGTGLSRWQLRILRAAGCGRKRTKGFLLPVYAAGMEYWRESQQQKAQSTGLETEAFSAVLESGWIAVPRNPRRTLEDGRWLSAGVGGGSELSRQKWWLLQLAGVPGSVESR